MKFLLNFLNHPLVKSIRTVLVASVIGGMVNGLIVKYGSAIIPYPEGYSYATEELMKSTIHLLKPINYIVPFMAHAIGTLVGCLIVYNFAFSDKEKLRLSLIVAGLFFMGGAIMVKILAGYSPTWFNYVDLIGAYFPMAFIAKFIKGKMDKSI